MIQAILIFLLSPIVLAHPLDGETCGERCPMAATPTPYVCNALTNCLDYCTDGHTLVRQDCDKGGECVADAPVDCNLELGGPPGFCMFFLGTYRCVFPP